MAWVSATGVPRVGMNAKARRVVIPSRRSSPAAMGFMVCADARALPFRDRSVDVAMCSQFLHHFEDGDAEHVVRELDRVARRAVIIADLRRSWIAAAGFWLVSFPMRFHPVTRHDGVVSVMRGFTAPELRRIVQAATGATATVSRYPGFRLTARWMRSTT